ncbi:unnamed protein product, partial [Polarella glacialis]
VSPPAAANDRERLSKESRGAELPGSANEEPLHSVVIQVPENARPGLTKLSVDVGDGSQLHV